MNQAGQTAVRWDCIGAEYHADDSISQSKIKAFLHDPEHYHDRYVAKTEPSNPPTSSQQFGLDVERYYFFGELPQRELVVEIPVEVLKPIHKKSGTEYHRTGPAWETWRAAQDPDAKLLRSHEMQSVQEAYQKKVGVMVRCSEKVKAHNQSRKLIFGEGIPHLALRWTDEETGLPCKCQFDMLHGPDDDPNMIVDLKTARDVTEHGFWMSVKSWSYHLQAWWYREAVRLWCGKVLPFVFVVQKNSPSYHVECYVLPDAWMDVAERKIRYAMHELSMAMETDTWTSPTHGRVVTLDEPPRWME